MWRVYLAFLLTTAFGVWIVFQTVKIQVKEGPALRKQAEKQSISSDTITARRGNIYADDGSLMATSMPIYDVRMDMMAEGLTNAVFNKGVDSLAYLLAKTFGTKSTNEYLVALKKARREKKRYFRLKNGVFYDELNAMKTWPLLRMGKYKGGFIVIEEETRRYPFGVLAKRTIGNSGNGGKPVGLEGAYNQVLAGVSGRRLMQKVAGGEKVPLNFDNEIEPEDGKDIYTTIDITIQDVAEEALRDALMKNNAESGTAILMEVKTGQIKAIANFKRTAPGQYKDVYNYAIGESLEPGSTFKLLSLIALLESGKAELDDSITIDNGETKFFGQTMKDSEKGNFNRLTLQQSFEKSSNVGISKFVHRHFAKNPEDFVDYIYKTGINKPLGISLGGEEDPVIRKPGQKGWSRVSPMWMSIGYEVQVTPMQILALYNAVANNGTMVKPIFVKEIRQAGQLIQQFETEVITESICSKSTLKKIRLALEGVVLRGTATNLKNPNYSVAGKTGTAQMYDKKGGYEEYYKSSFAGYFPADNPQYTCIVSINGASTGVYYGSLVAGPVFKEIADKVYATQHDLHPEVQDDTAKLYVRLPSPKVGPAKDLRAVLDGVGIAPQTEGVVDDTQWGIAMAKQNSMVIAERKVVSGLVPNVVGMGLKDAVYLIEQAGMKVHYSGKGKVRTQSIGAGTNVVRGGTVYIELK